MDENKIYEVINHSLNLVREGCYDEAKQQIGPLLIEEHVLAYFMGKCARVDAHMLAWLIDQAGDWMHTPVEHDPASTVADQMLRIACRAGALACVQAIVEKCGVRVDTSFNGREQEPLSMACRSGNAEVVRYLLQRGASPNVGQPSVSFPLLEAAHEGNLPMVRALVENGAAVNGLNPFGQSALSFARMGGHAETIAYLLSVGALEPREIVAQRQAANGG